MWSARSGDPVHSSASARTCEAKHKSIQGESHLTDCQSWGHKTKVEADWKPESETLLKSWRWTYVLICFVYSHFNTVTCLWSELVASLLFYVTMNIYNFDSSECQISGYQTKVNWGWQTALEATIYNPSQSLEDEYIYCSLPILSLILSRVYDQNLQRPQAALFHGNVNL